MASKDDLKEMESKNDLKEIKNKMDDIKGMKEDLGKIIGTYGEQYYWVPHIWSFITPRSTPSWFQLRTKELLIDSQDRYEEVWW